MGRGMARTEQRKLGVTLAVALGLCSCRDAPTQPADGTDDAGDETGPGDDDGDTGTGDDGADDTGTDGGEPDFTPPPGGMRRLLSHEYLASVEMLLGPEAAAAALPPTDGTVGGYDAVAAIELPLAPVAVEDYERSAFAVAEAAAGAPQTIAQTVPCVTADQGDDCYATLASDLGRLLWRRPLVEEEVDGLVAFAEQARTWGEGDFMVGVEYLLAAMLQSPNFVYVVEVGEPDPDGGARRLTGPELATRMSLFLLGRTPDATLLDLSDSFDDPDAVRDVAWQLVSSPEAVTQVDRFFNALLELRDLEDKGKDTELFPVWDEFTAASMREETLRLVRHLVFEDDGDVLDMFDADYTFIDPRMAAIYGVESPGPNWTQTTLPAEQGRAGILTHPSFLASQSYTRRNSPTRRGPVRADASAVSADRSSATAGEPRASRADGGRDPAGAARGGDLGRRTVRGVPRPDGPGGLCLRALRCDRPAPRAGSGAADRCLGDGADTR